MKICDLIIVRTTSKNEENYPTWVFHDDQELDHPVTNPTPALVLAAYDDLDYKYREEVSLNDPKPSDFLLVFMNGEYWYVEFKCIEESE